MRSATEPLYSRLARAGAAVALAAVVVAGVGVSPASAKDPRKDWGRNNQSRGRGDDYKQIALRNGYQAGFERGASVRQSRGRFDYESCDDYRRGNGGFNSGYGSASAYQSVYRQGYQQGYSDSYYNRARNNSYYNNAGYGYNNGRNDSYYRTRNRRPNNNGYYNNNSYGYGNGGYTGGYYDNRRGDLDPNEVAQRGAYQGYYDGYIRGQQEAASRQRPNPTAYGAYQNPFNLYDPDWGSAQAYAQAYRQNFLRGHQDGYQRVGNRNTRNRRWW